MLALGGLALLWLFREKPPAPGDVGFAGFRTELRSGPHETTYRQRDGAAAYDFWHYPLIDLTADVSGEFEIVWSYTNYVDGALDWESGPISNVFTLVGTEVMRLELMDTMGDPSRGQSIAYGDPDGIFDGVWHAFRSEVAVTVISPSGAQAATSGVLDEVFKSVGALSVSFAGFNVQEQIA